MNDYQTAIAELSLSGCIALSRCSRSTVYRWTKAINGILEREHYDQSCLPQAHGFNLEPHEFIRGSSQWRVKANYKEKALYVADI